MERTDTASKIEPDTKHPSRINGMDTTGWQSALLDLSYEPIFVWDWDGGIIQWNAGAEKLYGYSRSEVIGKSSHQVLNSKHPVALDKFLKKLNTDRFWAGEVRHTTKAGSEVIVESRQQLVRSEGRTLVLETNRDITDRRTGEYQAALLIVVSELISKLTKPGELMFSIAKTVGQYLRSRRCFFNEIDLDNDLETVHRDFCRGVDSVVGKHKISVYSPITSADMAAGKTVINFDSQADPRTADLYSEVYGPAGERSYVGVPLLRNRRWVASLWVSDDRPRHWSPAEIKLLQTVAERAWLAVEKLRNEIALRESESRFRHIADAAPVMIWLTDPAKSFTWFNKPWLDFTGRRLGEEIGYGWTSGIHTDDLSGCLATLVESFDDQKPFSIEFRLRRNDGEFRWLMGMGVPRYGPNRVFLGFIGSCIDITNNRVTEDALRASKAEIELILNGTPFMLSYCNRDLRYQYVSASYAAMLNRTQEDFIDAPIVDILGEEALKTILPRVKKVLGGEPVEYEDKVPFSGVGERHLRVFYVPVKESDGSVSGWIASIVDLTETKRAEGILDRYRLLSEHSNDIIWFTRPDGSFVDVNRAAVEAYGYSREELLRMNVRDLRHPSEMSGFQDQLNAANNGGIQFETLHIRKDGTALPVEARANSAEIGGEPLIMAIVRDISERKLADEALRKSEELFSRFMQHLPGLAWIKDTEGRYVYANDAAERAFHTPREILYGKNDTEIFPPDIAAQFQKNDQVALEGEYGVQTIETLDHDDGETHHSIVSKFPIFGSDARTTLIGGMAIDVSDRIRAEKALRESEERRKLAQEAGNVGIFDWDVLDGRTYWSETMWAFYGEEPSDINPDEAYWSAHLHDDDRNRVKLNIEGVMASTEEMYRDEFRIVRRDGSVRWIEAIARVSRDASGRAIRMSGVNLDITERKEIEERIRLSEYQLRLITNAVPALISYVDRSERFRFVNQRYAEWLGKPVEMLTGKKIKDVIGLTAYRTLKPHIDNALSGNECTFESQIGYKQAGERYIHSSFVPDVGVAGEIHGFYGLTHDLTDLRLSEELLRSSEERMGMFVESFADYAIFSMTAEGHIESWNRGAELIYGYSHDEIIGRSFETVLPANAIENKVLQKEMRLAKQRGRASAERWQLRKDGTEFFASGVLMPLFVGKKLTGYAMIASDLTEKQRRAAQLQQAHDELEVRVKERTKELADTNRILMREMEEREVAERQRVDLLRRLVSSQEFERRRIARDLHDQLGQRLTALRLKIASLNELSAGSPEFSARVERLQEIAERLDSEVSFLAWELRPTALDDLGLVDAVGAFVREWSRHYETPADFHSNGITRKRLNSETETHLYRITQEALNNIAKHANAKHVTVLLEKRDGNLILIIEDDGSGFDPTSDNVSADSSKGLGLIGMSERAALVGGDVEFESAPGQGTTIYVRVPLGS